MNQTYHVPFVGDISSTQKVKVFIPGSKSMTNRALLLATIAQGKSTLTGCLFSDDSRHFLSCIQELGIDITVLEEEKEIHINGTGGFPVKDTASIYVGSAGTAARFLTAYLGLCNGTYHLNSSEQMKKRPMDTLLNCLTQLGCEIVHDEKIGFFPFTLKSHGFSQEKITVDINKSSQFLSALLISSVLSKDDFTITTTGTHGLSYIHMTMKMMEQFGVMVDTPSKDCFHIPKGQHYQGLTYPIEPDLSAAAYFYGAGALLNVPVFIPNVYFHSLQGDIQFLRILESMGCSLIEDEKGITLYPPKNGQLQGLTVDMSTCSDQAITLAALAPFATSPTKITGISHIRYQECNRINAIYQELTRMNITCHEFEDGIEIFPGTPSPCEVETYDDHRMAMGFSLIGLKSAGIIIKNPSCCKKTFENYFETLEGFIQEINYTKK